MDFSAGQYMQLILALSLGVALFVAAYVAPIRITVPLLILLMPFQVITSRFGTMNMVLTYLVAAALLLRGKIRRLPMIGLVMVILTVYFASMSQVQVANYFQHLLYLGSVFSGFLVFYIVYNFVRELGDPRYLVRILLALNILVIAYCYLQLVVGFETLSLFGVNELTLQANREDLRLAGPFAAVGITAEYLAISILVIAFLLLYERSAKNKFMLMALIAANFAFLVATGNRGGLLSLAGGGILFLFVYRHQLGVRRIVTFAGGGALLFFITGAAIISYTEFDRLYERLAATTVESGVPDTRSKIWPIAWEKIKEKPVLGHGPRLRLLQDFDRRYPGHDPIAYPHNLYLFLLYTTGVVGLIAYLLFFVALFRRIVAVRRCSGEDEFLWNMVRLGPVLLIVVLVDQIKVEFLRYALTDYQHLFYLHMAIWVGLADTLRERSRNRTTSQLTPAAAQAGKGEADSPLGGDAMQSR